MKKYFFLFITIFFGANIFAQEIISDPNAPIMQFDSLTMNFGNVSQGTFIQKDFIFTNAGKSPLIIMSVRTSDGGCIATYPKEPIPSGKSGIITMKQSTISRMGMMDKTATIESNNRDGYIVIHIKGNVFVPEKIIDPNAAIITFDSTSYHFGKVKQGEVIQHEFHFTNTGKSPLVISECVTRCGCDVADAPKEPISLGGSGIIKYRFNTIGKIGTQEKEIFIEYNNETILLHIYGEVIP